MHKIVRRNLSTPKTASYASAINERGQSFVEVTYFNEAKLPVHHSQVTPAGKFMTISEFADLVKVQKDPAELEGKEREKKLKDTADLPAGRELTKSDTDVTFEPLRVDNDEVLKDRQPVGVKKTTKELKGKGPSNKVGDKTVNKGPDKRLSESNDHATYAWKAILRASTEIGLSEDDIKALAIRLSGSEITESEDPEMDLAVANDTDEPGTMDKGEEVAVGMTVRDLFNKIQAVSASDAKDVSGMLKGTQIKLIKHDGQKITKVVPSKVTNVAEVEGKLKAEVRVGDETKKFIIGRAGSVFLKRGRETGVYYYIVN